MVLLLFTLVNTVFRFINLGYSDFQGDEVSAQNYLFGEQNLIQFLLSRTIGPLQFIVTYPINYFFYNKNININFLVRLPFMLAGAGVIVAVYILCKKFFSHKTALYAAFFISISGLLLAFSRIVQYQSFVILLSVISVYYFMEYLNKQNKKYLIICGAVSGVSFLFHYDSLSFIIPIIIFLLLNFKKDLKNILYFVLPLLFIGSVFYIPFVFSPTFKETYTYILMDRIQSGFKFDSVYYSIKLLSIYHSKEFLIIFSIFIIYVFIKHIKRFTIFQKSASMFLISVILIRYFCVYQNRTLIYISFLLGVILFFSITAGGSKLKRFIFSWFLFSFVSYILFFTKPLTHIYVVFVPLIIFISICLKESLFLGINRIIIYVLLLFMGLSATSYNYQAFINTNPEYPWFSKRYIFGQMPDEVALGKEVFGIFGFPYYRAWDSISQKVKELDIGCYISNEKYRITKYYLQGYDTYACEPDILIWINKPQNYSDLNKPKTEPLISTDEYVIYKNNEKTY